MQQEAGVHFRVVALVLSLGVGVAGCFADRVDEPEVGEDDSGGTSTDPTEGDPDCPDGEEGCPCTSIGLCEAGLSCLSDLCVDAADDGGTGVIPACGNDFVDIDEECDGGDGCMGCQLVDYECNPFNQVGCADTQTCDRTRGATLLDQRTGCFQEGQAEYQQACQYDPLDPSLQCGDGLSCVGSAFVPGCDDLAECCTEFCIMGMDMCPDPAQECLTWKEVGMPPGLDDLGLCIRL